MKISEVKELMKSLTFQHNISITKLKKPLFLNAPNIG